MKRLTPFVPLLLPAALLLSPADALSGAKQGLEIWWGHVFPTLLPCLISVRLSHGLGLLRLTGRHPGSSLAAAVGFSLISGAPNGAKLLHALVEGGGLSPREGARILPLINSVSPVFLLSIIASEMLKNKALFLPMAAAFYGCVLCPLAPRVLFRKGTAPSMGPPAAKDTPFSEAVSAAIEGGMLDMMRIGGCIVLACTLLAIVRPLVADGPIYAALAACAEVSTGISAIAALSLPLRVKASLLVGAAAFGGLSLAMQTACCYPELRLARYLLEKLLLGVFTASVCYLLFPLFPGVSAVFANRREVISRSLSIGALLLSSVLSLAFMGVMGLMMSRVKTKD